LVIMAAITVSNMRRGVLLHKLVLIEVRPHLFTGLIKTSMLTVEASSGVARWIFCLFEPSRLWLVSLFHVYLDHSILESAQCDRLDEKQTILEPTVKLGLYLHSYLGSTLLDPGNIRQLCILQPRQRAPVCQDKAV